MFVPQKSPEDYANQQVRDRYTKDGAGVPIPETEILCSTPDFRIPSMSEIQSFPPLRPFPEFEKTLFRVSESIVMKHVKKQTNWIEVNNMAFVAENTSVPMPKVRAAIRHGPLPCFVHPRRNHHPANIPYRFDTYIFMDLVEGDRLFDKWPTYDDATKITICKELKGYLDQLHALPSPGYIGSAGGHRATDPIFGGEYVLSEGLRGPFATEEDFNDAIATAHYNRYSSHRSNSPYVARMLNSIKHRVMFVHNNLTTDNIMVRDGHVVAILDWIYAGWYPECWEFIGARRTEYHLDTWAEFLPSIVKPFFYEQDAYGTLLGARLFWD